MSFNSNGVTLTSQFNLKSKQPLDGRYVITNQTELANLLSLALYPGLEFMLTADVTHNSTTYKAGVYKVDSAGTSVNRIADTNGKLSTEHSITLTGDATGSANFSNGTASITVTVQDDSHAHIISNVDGLQDALNAKAPNNHASTGTTYGVSDASKYGHAMASSTSPKAAGTAAVGNETAKFARGDHVHPAQNAFTRVTVGTTNIDADTATDALTLVAGDNITITPDATNDKITISSSYQNDNTAHTHIDGNGLTRTGDGGISGTVKLEVKPANGIAVDATGVGVKEHHGITVDANGVSVKPKSSGGIVVDANGVSVNTGFTSTGSKYKVAVDGTSGGLYVEVPVASHAHGNITNAGQLGTASRVVVTDSNKNITVSSDITTTELGYLNGVTSAIQTQLDDKSPKVGNTGLVTTGTVTAGTWASTIKGTANVDGTSVDMTVDELLDCLVWHEF